METKVSFVKAFYDRYKLQLTVTETAVSIENNTSTVSYSLVLIALTAYNFWGYNVGQSVDLDGRNVGYVARAAAPDKGMGDYGTLQLLSGSGIVIPHDADGTKTLSMAFSIDMASDSNAPGPMSTSDQMALTPIARASSITCPDATMGTGTTINIYSASSAFTHTLSYNFKGATGVIATKTTMANVPWTPLPELANQITSTEFDYCTVYCETFNGNTSVGTKNIPVKLSIPPSVRPVVNPGWVTFAPLNDNSVVQSWGVYVRGFSAAKATFNANYMVMQYGAIPSVYKITCGGIHVTAPPYQTAKITTAGAVDILCSVQDSRGRWSDQTTITVQVLDYAAPDIYDVSLFRCDVNGDPADRGQYICAKATIKSYDCGARNTATMKVRYRLMTGNYNYSNDIALVSNERKIIGANGISYAANYEAQISISDSINPSVAPYTRPIPSADVSLNFMAGGKGARFGGYADTENVLKVDWALDVDGNIKKGGVNLIDLFYPVGAIFMSTVNTNPATVMGGTWTAWGAGRVPVGVSTGETEFNTVEKTGGAKTHTLTAAQIAAHGHGFSGTATAVANHTHTTPGWLNASGSGNLVAEAWSSKPIETNITGSAAGGHGHTVTGTVANNTGGDNAHPNLQPYITCYMWKRTA